MGRGIAGDRLRHRLVETPRAGRCDRSSACWLHLASKLLIDGIRQQAVFDLGDVNVLEVIDEISPRIV